jgi:hypothetical protein
VHGTGKCGLAICQPERNNSLLYINTLITTIPPRWCSKQMQRVPLLIPPSQVRSWFCLRNVLVLLFGPLQVKIRAAKSDPLPRVVLAAAVIEHERHTCFSFLMKLHNPLTSTAEFPIGPDLHWFNLFLPDRGYSSREKQPGPKQPWRKGSARLGPTG